MAKKKKDNAQPWNHFSLKEIKPLTPNQSETFDAFTIGKHLLLHGVAGTGKTFITLYLALREVLHSNRYKQIVIVRSVVPSRDVGFMPGNLKEKIKVYEDPYKVICDDLFARGDGYEILKQKRLIDFTTTSFLRGMTFDNSIIIVDEVQNMSDMETHTIMTRVGDNTRIILCGDFRQRDYMREASGIHNLLKVSESMPSFDIIEFSKEDVVRSGFVREYLFARMRLDEAGNL